MRAGGTATLANLIHSGVGEQQGGVVMGNAGRGVHEGVLALLGEVVHECLADKVGGPMGIWPLRAL